MSFGDESEQYLVAAVLLPGSAHGLLGAIGILRRLVANLRKAFPKTRLRLRLDGGFAMPEIFDFLEEQGIEYLVAMARNARLGPRGARLLARARRRQSGPGRAPPASARPAMRHASGRPDLGASSTRPRWSACLAGHRATTCASW